MKKLTFASKAHGLLSARALAEEYVISRPEFLMQSWCLVYFHSDLAFAVFAKNLDGQPIANLLINDAKHSTL